MIVCKSFITIYFFLIHGIFGMNIQNTTTTTTIKKKQIFHEIGCTFRETSSTNVHTTQGKTMTFKTQNNDNNNNNNSNINNNLRTLYQIKYKLYLTTTKFYMLKVKEIKCHF